MKKRIIILVVIAIILIIITAIFKSTISGKRVKITDIDGKEYMAKEGEEIKTTGTTIRIVSIEQKEVEVYLSQSERTIKCEYNEKYSVTDVPEGMNILVPNENYTFELYN